MSAQILIIVGPDRGRSFDLTPGSRLEIGRSQSTATCLTDATVSRVHCEIAFDGKVATLSNKSSKGTQVNGLDVSTRVLRHGDVIRMGGTEIRYGLRALEEAETLYQQGGKEPGRTSDDAHPTDA